MTDLETLINDLPRRVDILKSIVHGDELGETEQREALVLAIDELHAKAVEARQAYYAEREAPERGGDGDAAD